MTAALKIKLPTINNQISMLSNLGHETKSSLEPKIRIRPIYTVLYCNVLCSTVPYCTVLYRTVLYRTVLYYTVLYCTVVYCTILYCTVLYILYCTITNDKICPQSEN